MSRENPVIKLLAIGLFLSCLVASTFATAASKSVHIVFLGDSLTAGYGLDAGQSYVDIISKKLSAAGYQFTFENAGVSGDTSAGGLARLDWSVPEGTNGVILELGANDALRGLPAAETEKNLDEIITRLKQKGTDVLLAGMMAPPNMGTDYEAAFNPIYKRLAEKHDIPLYDFILDGVAGDPGLNQADAIHPNIEGSKIIAERFFASVEAFLTKLQNAS